MNDLKVTREYLNKEPLTQDGVRIDIGVNIAGTDEDELAAAAFTDYVGLFRTEFLYLGRDTLPTEEEQFAAYKKALERFGGRPVTIRTLDIGGDKTLPCMNLPKEDNPFLGNRALRLCFSKPDLFRTQLRALLRASEFGNLWLMLPMIGSIDDIRRAKETLAAVRAELEAERIPVGDFKTGIMIEIPAIAMIADKAAKEVDFASLGTNDLCQYLLAVDRLNPAVAPYYQSLHPGLLRIIAAAIRAFIATGKPISVCGEMGGDVLAAPLLVGMGLRKLSMGRGSVARIKRTLAGLTLRAAQDMAARALDCATAAEVESLVKTMGQERE
jgi:phosphotransferase system enzyme I (PtsI)